MKMYTIFLSFAALLAVCERGLANLPLGKCPEVAAVGLNCGDIKADLATKCAAFKNKAKCKAAVQALIAQKDKKPDCKLAASGVEQAIASCGRVTGKPGSGSTRKPGSGSTRKPGSGSTRKPGSGTTKPGSGSKCPEVAALAQDCKGDILKMDQTKTCAALKDDAKCKAAIEKLIAQKDKNFACKVTASVVEQKRGSCGSGRVTTGPAKRTTGSKTGPAKRTTGSKTGSGTTGSKPGSGDCNTAKIALALFKADAKSIDKDVIKRMCDTRAKWSPTQKQTLAKCGNDLDTKLKFIGAACDVARNTGGTGKVCVQPKKASKDQCKGLKDNTKDACGLKLVKDCIDGGLQGCDANPDKSVCTPAEFKKFVVSKPSCALVTKDFCKQVAQNQPKQAAKIPTDCTSWFDGCNKCDGTGKACTKMFCSKKGPAFCMEFKDGRKCIISRSTRTPKPVCKKAGEKPKPITKPTCDDIKADLNLRTKDACKKAVYLCKNDPVYLQACKTSNDQEDKKLCGAATSKSRKSKCCIQSKLSGVVCKDYGASNKLPDDCDTKCFKTDGVFKVTRDCVSCRGKDDLRAKGGKGGDDSAKRPFDPARVKETVKDIASKLDQDGKKCVKRIAEATVKLRTKIQRWRNNDPNKDVEPEAATENKQLAEVQAEIEETVDESKILEDEFANDNDGKNFRDNVNNLQDRIKDKISDDNKPENCKAEFSALKTAFNVIVDDYKGLPAKLTTDGVARVPFDFSDIDVGSTKLKDSKSMCQFAKRLVTKMKKAETNHNERLKKARNLLCTKGGDLLKNKRLTNLFNCLRAAKRTADAGSDDSQKKQANSDVSKFDSKTLQRVKKLLSLMRKKCLMKDSNDSDPAPLKALFTEKVQRSIKKKAGGAWTEAEKKQIADKCNEAVQKQFTDASNIKTTLQASTRRQLRDRRALVAVMNVMTTWESNAPPSASAGPPSLDVANTFQVSNSQMSALSTSRSIQGTNAIAPIDDQLPSGSAATTTPSGVSTSPSGVSTSPLAASTTNSDVSTSSTEKGVDAGTKGVAFGAATVICATLWFF